MADALNIVLYPLVPTDGGDFQARYLTGLTVSAYEVDAPHPVPAAGAQPPGNLIGTATYDKNLVTANVDAILQHRVKPAILLPDVAAAAASAVIFLGGGIDAGQPYVNVVLHLDRGGVNIADRSMNYDAPVVSLTTPINGTAYDSYEGSPQQVNCFDVHVPPSLYVGLAPPAGALGTVTLPADGSPPNFADLKDAVTKVLAIDPHIIDPAAPVPDLAALSPQQCTHIAREMLWLRTTVNPVPLPEKATHDHVALEMLYTGPPATPPAPATSFSGDDKDREEFQGALDSYYAQLDASTARLAQYSYAMSTAMANSVRAGAADSAELVFPVRRTTTPAAGQIATAAIRIRG